MLSISLSCSVSFDFEGTRYRCPDGVSCPGGFTCVDSVCVTEVPSVDAGSDGTDGGISPRVACGEVGLIRTDFEDGFPWWSFLGTVNGGSVSADEGVLRIEAPLVAGDFARLGDKYHVALRGSRLSVEVANVISSEPYIRFSEQELIELAVVGTELVGTISFGATTTNGSIPYAPSVHRHWGISESNGVMALEVSEDGIDWTVVHSRAAPLSIEFGHFEIGVRSIGVSGSGEFDNINGGGPPSLAACTLGGVVEEFDDSLVDPLYTSSTSDCLSTIVDGRLRFTHLGAAGALPFCLFETSFRSDLRDSSIAVENVSFPPFVAGQYHQLSITAAGGAAAIFTNNGSIFSEICTSDNDCSNLNVSAFDSTVHRFWRIRDQDQTTFWEVSPNGVTWTALASLIGGLDVSDVQAQLLYGSDSPNLESLEIDRFGPG